MMPTVSKSRASADSLAKWARKALACSGRAEIDTRLTRAHGRCDKTKPTMGTTASCVGFCSTVLPRFHLHFMQLRCGVPKVPIKAAVATIKVEVQDNLACFAFRKVRLTAETFLPFRPYQKVRSRKQSEESCGGRHGVRLHGCSW